jgi:large subunit GTPase 1
VFPNFVTNKATMVCSGLLPIDELRDWRSPGSVVCQRIKRNVLEAHYGVVLPEPDKDRFNNDPNRAPTVDELLSAYAFVRGFMGQSGAPNMARAGEQFCLTFFFSLCYLLSIQRELCSKTM